MAYRRPFSFTDDSININDLDERLKPNNTPSLFSASLKPAEDLVQLRRIQSAAYQKLFQSISLSTQTAWPIMHAAVHEMGHWYSLTSSQEDQIFRNYYRFEVLYGIFLVMTPAYGYDLSPYGRILQLQYAMEIADSIQSAIGLLHWRDGLYTSHDIQRISFVAQRFLELITSNHKIMFSSLRTMIPTTTVDSASSSESGRSWPLLSSPLFQNQDASGRLNRIYRSLDVFEMALKHFCSTYGYPEPLHEYQISVSALKSTLQASY